jgi:hypothetical protein
MAAFLDRYLAGDHNSFEDDMRALGKHVGDKPWYTEAVAPQLGQW